QRGQAGKDARCAERVGGRLRPERHEVRRGAGEPLVIAEEEPSRVRCLRKVEWARDVRLAPGDAIARLREPVIGRQRSGIGRIVAEIVVAHAYYTVIADLHGRTERGDGRRRVDANG